MATEKELVEHISNQAMENAAADLDTETFAYDVYKATEHMLGERVTVVPGEDDEESQRVKWVLCGWWLLFYLGAIEPRIGGSLGDYCVEHVSYALDGYVVDSIDDPKAMLDDIAPAIPSALDKERLFKELASIGIA